jgi:hypothetical protein
MSNSKGDSLERGIWAAVIISALIVILRVFAKIKIKRFHVDDVLMIIAQVWRIFQSGVLFHAHYADIAIATGSYHCVDRFPELVCATWLWW